MNLLSRPVIIIIISFIISNGVARNAFQHLWRSEYINQQVVELLFFFQHLLQPIQMYRITQHQDVHGIFAFFDPDALDAGDESRSEGFGDQIHDGDVEGDQRHVEVRDGQETLGDDEEGEAKVVDSLVVSDVSENTTLRELLAIR